MYAVYHGPDGLKQIAERTHGLAAVLAAGAEKLGLKVAKEPFFDTIRIDVSVLWRAGKVTWNLLVLLAMCMPHGLTHPAANPS